MRCSHGTKPKDRTCRTKPKDTRQEQGQEKGRELTSIPCAPGTKQGAPPKSESLDSADIYKHKSGAPVVTLALGAAGVDATGPSLDAPPRPPTAHSTTQLNDKTPSPSVRGSGDFVLRPASHQAGVSCWRHQSSLAHEACAAKGKPMPGSAGMPQRPGKGAGGHRGNIKRTGRESHF